MAEPVDVLLTNARWWRENASAVEVVKLRQTSEGEQVDAKVSKDDPKRLTLGTCRAVANCHNIMVPTTIYSLQ